ncbi:pre-mRNA-processing protein 40C isoform X1 [Oryza glaberrima]|uniref:pre-mRNA-processing protein 40C isoform X1 n=1 Tax=Oryza glaberrima TaxID=4538 RepID=UPI00224C5068|nr:pre-mRNA-processing protein 40C isoform X1 [Oryza glaberrima]
MATPSTAASDATNPEAAEVPSAAPASESEGPFDSGVVAAATTPAVVDSAVEGDAPAAPAPTSGSGPAAPSMPANPASPATPGPPRPQFAGLPAYASPPAPAFSYNVLPRPSPRPQVGSGAAQQQLASPPTMMAPSVAAAALQPPVPGQYFGNRPSFSYNVVSHANAGLPTGQQFQLDTGTNHAVQVSRFVPPSSLQPPAPMNLARPSSAFPGAGAMPPNPPGSIRLPFPGPPRPSINTFVASPQQAQPQASQLPSNSGSSDVSTSRSDTRSVPEASPQTMQLSTGPPSTSTAGSPSITVQMPTNPSLPTRPEVFGAVGASVPGQPSTILSPPPSLLGRPMTPSASPFPQTSQSPTAFQQLGQQQLYPSYPSAHGVQPQPLWGYPPQPTGFQQPPFQSYPSGLLGPLGRPMVGSSSVTAYLPSIQPPGVSTTDRDSKELSSANPGSEQPTQQGSQNSDQLEDKRTTAIQDSDSWSAHKTEAGVVYYYNALTGESTYQKPPGYKGEPEKVAAQPVPVSWDKLAGTDWSIVTTSDGKKYYYDNKLKVSSWQLPPEVAELIKNAESGPLKGSSTSLQDAGTIGNKEEISIDIDTPAVQTGGRDSLPLRQTVAPASSSALDLIKKKLQDAGASSVPSPLATPSSASELNGSKTTDAAPMGHQVSISGEKSKDNSGDGNMSDSSSNSDDEEHGPSEEECTRQFKEMLKERGVLPFSKWEKELPKIVFDPRFKAIPSHSRRRSTFEQYVRTRADEERKEKRAAQRAAVEAYKQLLEEASEDINSNKDYKEFKRKWGTDPRFEALDRKERDALFNEKVKSIEEKVQSVRNAVIAEFKSMLRESKDITSTSRWTKVKENFRSDARYKAMKHEEREVAFNEYIAELKSAEKEAEQAAKAKLDEQAKLKEREREMRKRKEREEQEMERVKLKIRRKEAVSSYQALLVEIIKDPKASWTESKPRLEKDPQGRAVNPDLGKGDAEKLFRDHVKDLYERCARDFRALLSEVITPEIAARTTDEGKTAINSWTEAKGLLRSDPRYNKLASKDRESIWRRYADDMATKLKQSDTKEKSDTDGKQRRSSDPPRRR